AWSLCFVGAYLLARELGLGRLGAAAAGVAFAYAPYRVTEAGHLHVISSGGIPLALLLLLRGYRPGSRGLVLAGSVVTVRHVRVASADPAGKRTLKEVRSVSAGAAGLLAASSENRVWGGATSGMRAKVHAKNESVFFPGGLILLLAAIGLAGVGGSAFTA